MASALEKYEAELKATEDQLSAQQQALQNTDGEVGVTSAEPAQQQALPNTEPAPQPSPETQSAVGVRFAPMSQKVIVEPSVQGNNEWEQKYKVLQGKFNAEVPVLSKELAELRAQVASLQSKNEELSRKPVNVRDLLNDEEREAVGDVLPSIMEKIAKNSSNEYEKQLSALKSQIESNRMMDAMTRTASLAGLKVSELQQLDTDPEFNHWLSNFGVHGLPVQRFLDEAIARGDLQTAAEIYKEYLSMKNPKPQVQPVPPTAVPHAPVVAGAKPMQRNPAELVQEIERTERLLRANRHNPELNKTMEKLMVELESTMANS